MTYTIICADNHKETVVASSAEVVESGALVFTVGGKLIAGFAPGEWFSFTHEDD